MIREDWVEGKLEDLLNYIQPTNYIVESTAYNDNYKTPVLTAGKTFILGYTDEENNIFTALPVIIFDDFTTATKYVNFKFKVKSSAMKILVPTSDMVNVKYVYYHMQTIRQNVDTHKRYWISIFSKLDITIAPLAEQKAIVARIEELFSELDSGIESLKKAKEQLEIYRQAVLKAAFEGKLTREWRIEKKYTEKYLEETKHKIHEFNSNKAGQDIPRRLPTISFENLPSNPFGWLWIEAHKVCQSVRDGTHDTPRYVKEGIPLITSKNLKKGNIDFGNVNYISLTDHKEISNRSKVEKNDILFGMIGTIGNPVIVKENNFFSIKNVGLFKKNEDLINPKYLYYYLSSWFVEKIMLDQELIRGTTQKFIALGGLRMLPIPLPSLNEQEVIIREIESRLSVCENIEANIEEALGKAEALRQGILKKAFEGKLLSKEELGACRQEDDWEPAEDLLKRIKEANKEVN